MKKDITRFIFIDLLRGWALIIMIEVHIFNAFLIPSLKDTSWFTILNFINGLVAPSFLFVSGFAFIISTERRIEEIRKYGKYFWNKLLRIGLIFLAGYSLHLPYFSFSKILGKSSEPHFNTIFNVDILQCIATGLLVLLLLKVLIKKDKIFYSILIFLTILISLISFLIWKIDFSRFLPIFFAAYFNQLFGSFFPLFPWLFFLFSGAIFSRYYIISRDNNREKEFIMRNLVLGLILIFIGHFFLSVLSGSSIAKIRPNPLFLYERLGYVLTFSVFCWLYVLKRETKTSFVLDVSRESLLIYWLHLEIIYAPIWSGGKSLEQIVAESFSVTQCIISTLLLIVLMVIVAKIWGNFKKKYPVYLRPVTAGIITLALIIFILKH